MINLIIISFVGAVLNRVRGGGLHHTIERYVRFKILCLRLNLLAKDGSFKFVKDIHALCYGLLFGYLTSYSLIVVYFAAMRLNFGPGWGGYIGAMIDRAISHNRRDIMFLDKWFRSDRFPRLSGFLALTIRGLLGTIILAIPFFILTPKYFILALSGLLMGLVYLISIELSGFFFKDRTKGWHYGEYFYGALLWGLSYYILL